MFVHGCSLFKLKKEVEKQIYVQKIPMFVEESS